MKTATLFGIGSIALFSFTGCTADVVEAEIDGETAMPDEAVSEVGEALVTKSDSVTQGTYKYYEFTKVTGGRYTICIDVASGDANLYGHYNPSPSKSNRQFWSENSGTTSDCISFEASSTGTYYYSVYGYASGTSNFTIRRSSSDNLAVPTYLQYKLARPNACTAVTEYGPFNMTWGNPSFKPFYNGYKNYIHNGTDFSCPPSTAVKAVCSGPIKASGNLGSTSYNGSSYPWGMYVVQECTGGALGTNKVTIAYDHLKSTGLVTQGTLYVGQQVGTIVDLQLPGEPDHLHLGVCAGAYSSCTNLHGGASPDTAFPPANFINPAAAALWAP